MTDRHTSLLPAAALKQAATDAGRGIAPQRHTRSASFLRWFADHLPWAGDIMALVGCLGLIVAIAAHLVMAIA